MEKQCKHYALPVIANPTLTWENHLILQSRVFLFDVELSAGDCKKTSPPLLPIYFFGVMEDIPPPLWLYGLINPPYINVNRKTEKLTACKLFKKNLLVCNLPPPHHPTTNPHGPLTIPPQETATRAREGKKKTSKLVISLVCLCWPDPLPPKKEIDNSARHGTRPNVGDIKYRDLNGDGKIDEDDRKSVGRGNRSELTYGLNLNCAWNRFDFKCTIYWRCTVRRIIDGYYYNGYDDNTV
ncbi:hypothetical protein NXW94_30055, partial [Bacteroides ovatus]|nr:hypothetical protein [Bacteroides ovatus]